MNRRLLASLAVAPLLVLAIEAACARAADGVADAPAESGLASSMQTPWAKEIDRNAVLPEYPRPQLVRKDWTNLNGVWQFAKTRDEAAAPEAFDREILVPFPVESTLSGVAERVEPEDTVWYRREFEVNQAGAKPRDGGRLLLHFGAVDWEATVWVNGVEVGTHQGGFDPFSFDITDALVEGDQQTLLVRVKDPTNHGVQPHGKQSLEPGGIVYTAVTGIWQTVWLEPVPATRIVSLKLTPHVDSGELEVKADVIGPDADRAIVRLSLPSDAGAPIRATGKANRTFRLKIANAHLWSPEDPFLYDLKADLAVGPPHGERVVTDSVDSYFGMRSIELLPNAKGHNRIHLNGKPVFSFGPLDQGWWPDGLYTAPTDKALRWDIEITKRYGFNTARKHVKVEPARWYYWCDKLGLLVWQDMPNGDRGIGSSDEDMVRTPESEATFRHELAAMMDTLHNHPSIAIWVPFNEGWGQFKTNEILEWTKQYDPTRLVDGPSGWTDRGEGDLHDMHNYPGPAMFPAEPERGSVLGEFGGLGLALPGRLWMESGNWGYQSYEDAEELATKYKQLIDNLWVLKGDGLAAAIYTQTTDVEGEVNGLVTYDRKVLKIDPEEAAVWNRRLYQPPPAVATVLSNSEDPDSAGELWSYTTEKPGSGWQAKDFDTSGWRTGRAGFGTPNTPGATVRTEWDSSDIWMRRELEIEASDLGENLYLVGHHDEDAEVYLNGKLIIRLQGFTLGYKLIALPESALKCFSEGKNTLAIHCRQTDGGQYIDLGIVSVGDSPGETDSGVELSSRGDQALPSR